MTVEHLRTVANFESIVIMFFLDEMDNFLFSTLKLKKEVYDGSQYQRNEYILVNEILSYDMIYLLFKFPLFKNMLYHKILKIILFVTYLCLAFG